MKTLIYALVAIFLTVGCRQDKSATPGSPQSQNETNHLPVPPQTSRNNSGGGIDSSGGDLILSSDSQVAAALEDFNNKVYSVVFRMGLEMIGAEKTDFEEKFGENSYALIRDFLKSDGRLKKKAGFALKEKLIEFEIRDASCEGDHQDKAGSAQWKNETPSICISKQSLKKMSPDSLQIDSLALGVHELAHIYGYDEAKAQAMQSFVIKNKGLLWPHKDQLSDVKKSATTIVDLYVNLLLNFRDQKNMKLCSNVDLMLRENNLLLQNRYDKTSIVLPSIVMQRMESMPASLDEITDACEKGDTLQIRNSIAKNALGLFRQMVNVFQMVQGFVDPTKQEVLATFAAMDIMGLLDNPEIVKATNPKAPVNTRIEMEDVACRFQSERDWTSTGRQFNGDKTKGVGVIDLPMSPGDSIMLRRTEGLKGVGFAIMSKTLQVTATQNMIATNGGEGITLYASVLIPGINENLQFEIQKDGRAYKVRCGYKINGKYPDLNYETKKTPEGPTRDENDDHFFLAPKKEVFLRIRLNKPGQANEPGGADTGTLAVTKIRFNGMIALKTENESCIISEDMIQKKSLNKLALANEILNGKYKEIVCDMNGSMRPDGKITHAPWAFDFSIKD